MLYYLRVVPAPLPADLAEELNEAKQPPEPLRLAIVTYYAQRTPHGEVLRVDLGIPEEVTASGPLAR